MKQNYFGGFLLICYFILKDRLVESSSIKKSIEETYSTFLPKNTHPFVYLALQVKPQNVDVNVHPTKSEVHILNEDSIISDIQKNFEAKLLQCNNSRNFPVQQTLVSDNNNSNQTFSSSPSNSISSSSQTSRNLGSSSNYVAPKQKIRTDSRTQPLTAFFEDNKAHVVSQSDNEMNRSVPLDRMNTDMTNDDNLLSIDDFEVSSQSLLAKRKRQQNTDNTANYQSNSSVSNSNVINNVNVNDDIMDTDFDENPRRKQSRKRTVQPVLLTSVSNLIEEFEQSAHKGLLELFHNFTFVGCADCNFALIQHKTKLYLIKLSILTDKLFYQESLRKFSNLPLIRLSTPASIEKLIIIALEDESSGWSESEGTKEEIASVSQCFFI